ncbi:hypothetical protein [Robiginitalea sp. IMCC43444]|uniref:hypothetical protein n=1 Tax=Robiginitalea sp. IMCC43444 TaxID=3459121 RepID=UPI0040427D98
MALMEVWSYLYVGVFHSGFAYEIKISTDFERFKSKTFTFSIMKRYILLLLTVFLSGIYAEAQTKKIAIVTFYADKLIGADKLAEGARASFYEMAEKENEQFDIEPILINFHEVFKEDYLESFPFEIVPEEEVINNPGYRNYELPSSITVNPNRFISIDGYQVLVSGGNLLRSWRTESHMLEVLSDLDIDGVMYISLYYTWEPKIALGGVGNVGIKANITMELYNSEAKKVFSHNESAVSKKSVALVGAVPVMNYDKLIPMCQNATEMLVKDLNKRIPKLTKKVGKKLISR